MIGAVGGGLLRLVVEIDPDADPVAGTVRATPGVGHAFTGWTQLGHVLGQAIAEGDGQSDAGDAGEAAPAP